MSSQRIPAERPEPVNICLEDEKFFAPEGETAKILPIILINQILEPLEWRGFLRYPDTAPG